MIKPFRGLLLFVVLILIFVIVGPLVVPIPPLMDVVPVEQLADAESRFIEVNGITVHYKQFGQGQPVMVLLHGFGASTFSWREVLQPLSEYGAVIAFDRPAFGLTERLLPGDWSGENPYGQEGQVRLTIGLLDALDIDQAILIGHSAGGAVAAAAAIQYPQRIEGLVFVDAAIYASGGAPRWIRPLLNTPQFNRIGPWFSRSLAGEQGTAFLRAAWYDPSRISDEIIAGYRKPLKTENWDVALWELTKANPGSTLDGQLGLILQPALVISGANDRIVPTSESERLADELPQADLVIIPDCGHLPQEEKPSEFLAAVLTYLQNNQFIK